MQNEHNRFALNSKRPYNTLTVALGKLGSATGDYGKAKRNITLRIDVLRLCDPNGLRAGFRE